MAFSKPTIVDDDSSGETGTIADATFMDDYGDRINAAIDGVDADVRSVALGGTGASTLTGVLKGNGTSAITASAQLAVTDGGTGAATLAAKGIVFGNGTSAVGVTGAGTSGQVLTSNGAGVDPTFQDAAGGGDASQQIAFTPAQNNPPATIYATPDVRNSHPVLDFDAATSEEAIFSGVFWEDYAGEDVTVTIQWAASTATSGDVKWNAMFERIASNDLDIDADSFATAQTATGTANGTSGKLTYTTITFTSAQTDGLLAGESFRLKVARHASDAGDTMTGDAEILRVVLRKVAA